MRRASSPFSLSLLDLLTSALGAVIFLFIITPKGGASPSVHQQAGLFLDTTTMQLHGTLPDSLVSKMGASKLPGDTLLALLIDYKTLPKPEPKVVVKQEEPKAPRVVYRDRPQPKPVSSKPPIRKPEPKVAPRPKPTTKPRPASTKRAPTKKKPTADPAYRGTPPSVPARVSFELKWADKSDNVDLFVCQGNTCVYGNNKRERSIGQWDSGKSRNRLFGNDLRTNMEAVRQFDKLLPGTYTVYAMFKESAAGRNKITVDGLVYTKDTKNKPRGKTFTKTLTISEQRTRLATVTINADGTFTMR